METFEKVYIKSEADLPKEQILIFVYSEKEHEGFYIKYNPLDTGCVKNLLLFNWYLRPTKLSEVKEPAVTDDELSAILDSMNYETSKERENAWDLCMILRSRLQPAQIDKLQLLMNDISKWSDKQFGEHQRNPAIAYHLLKETQELIEAFEKGIITQEETDKLKMEFADCFMLILDSATHAFLTADDLLNAAREKLEINKKREWGKPDENGVVEHIPAQIPMNR